VVGSVGFLPSIYNRTDRFGVLGFIIGSAFIGCSQAWKVLRIGRSDRLSCLGTVFSSSDKFTAAGVEFSAGLGAWCFFVGTLMYDHGPLVGDYYNEILIIWEAGSVFFTLGGLFLAYRHGVMKVA
jgi:hypothetical protein